MAIEVIMPKAGLNMTEGTISEWFVEDGARVEKGQPLFSYETDKVVNEVEAEGSGTIHHEAEVGGTVAVGGVVGRIVEDDEA